MACQACMHEAVACAGVPLAQQVAVLEYRMDGTVATADDPPAVLGRMPPAFIAQMGPRLRAGRLLRFRIGPAGIFFKDGMPVSAPVHAAWLFHCVNHDGWGKEHDKSA